MLPLVFPLDLFLFSLSPSPFSLLFSSTLSISSLYLFYESSFSITQKKDTSCYLTLLAAHKCYAIKSTMPHTSPGSSRTILHLPRRQSKTKRTPPSGSSLSNIRTRRRHCRPRTLQTSTARNPGHFG